MREDQYIKLQGLHAKLVDVALHEADPENWTGAGVSPKDLTQQDRGDRYWCKKNAVATISLAIRIDTLLGKVQGYGVTPGEAGTEDDPEREAQGLLDAEVKAAERQASALLKKYQKAAAGSG